MLIACSVERGKRGVPVPHHTTLVRCSKDLLVVLASFGNALLHRGRVDRPGSRRDSPGIQEDSRTPSRQSDSVPAHLASRRAAALLRKSAVRRAAALLVCVHLRHTNLPMMLKLL